MNSRFRFACILGLVGLAGLAATQDAAAQRIMVRPYFRFPLVFAPIPLPVVVRPAPVPVVVVPQPVVAQGCVQFDVQPRLAEVWVDGAYRGKAQDFEGRPGSLVVPVGAHIIDLRFNGYRSLSFQVIVRADAPVALDLALEPITVAPQPPPPVVYKLDTDQSAALQLDLTPLDAAVYVDGAYYGTAQELHGRGPAVMLRPGRHRLDAAAPSHAPWSAEYDLKPAEHRIVKAQLPKTTPDGPPREEHPGR